jgi:ligand-binding sensor domain-containing protein
MARIRAGLIGISCLAATLATTPGWALDPQRLITQYVHRTWTSHEGLPQNSVLTLTQGADGYLWMGTQEGLVRFDGARFTVFDRDLPHAYVTALVAEGNGTLWIGTLSGLVAYRDGAFRTYGVKDGLASGLVRALAVARDGSLWVGTEAGISHLASGQWRSYTTRDGLPGNNVNTLLESRDGSLWLGTEGSGLARLKDGHVQAYAPLADITVKSLCQARDGSLWIGTLGHGLIRLENGRFRGYRRGDGLLSDSVKAVLEDRDGQLWVGTDAGLNRFHQGRLHAYTAKDGLSGDVVAALHEDREGSLWIGTEGGGLNQLQTGKFLTYTPREGLSHHRVRPVYGSGDGSLWVGTEGGGLNHLVGGRVSRVYTVEDGLASNELRALRETRDGALWIGTSSGLNRLEKGRLSTFTTRQGLPNNYVRALEEGPDGSLWIGTSGGLGRLRNGRFQAYTAGHGLPNDTVRALLVTRDGSLWIATNYGLSRFRDEVFTEYKPENGLPAQVGLSFYEDLGGSLWIGTGGSGLLRFKDGAFRAVTAKAGLFDDVVLQISEDHQGYFWMGSNKGIARVLRRDVEDFFEGRRASVPHLAFSTQDGESEECNAGSPGIWKDGQGRLWFPTIRGLIVVDPARIPNNPQRPPVIVESLQANKHSFRVAPGLRLPAGYGDLEFTYTALSFLAPQKVRFKYKLEGYDQDWREADTVRVAHYTNLSPATYTFRVIACNNDGLWNEAGASLAFTLEPHAYQTWWFSLLAVAAATLAVVGVHRLRVRKLAGRERRLAERVDEAMARIKVLTGLLPICSSCKSIRDDQGYWNQLERYLIAHSEVQFSHGLCPECLQKLYPEYYESVIAKVVASKE